MKKNMDKIILGLKIGGNSGPKQPLVQGWAVIKEKPIINVEYRKMENLKENEVFDIARKNIGQYLKAIRIDSHITISDVAIKSGLTASQIESIENGSTDYSIDIFLKLVRGLDCYLFLKQRDGKHLDESDIVSASNE